MNTITNNILETMNNKKISDFLLFIIESENMLWHIF